MNQKPEIAPAGLLQPVLPLARLLLLLFLTGPFSRIEDVLAELNEPVESQCRYDDPQAAAGPYLDILQNFTAVKSNKLLDFIVVDEENHRLDRMEALELWVGQQILARELGGINSLLCGNEHCDLCCTGPKEAARQNFFEIPLMDDETGIFNLTKIDSAGSRRHTAGDDQALELDDGQLFYHRENPALYHWRGGWSLILPRQTSCPNLGKDGRCLIYAKRPVVCRQPQIFPYLLEPDAQGGTGTAVYIARRKLLAIWDCPYVKQFREQIAAYAELCGLEPIFKENKA
ncbi:MAG: hypothetical protein GXP59_08850 [Deltaproteobacteria bacterium]|nr:hypothetical protein [Deltaproteobacteria bacterium]